MKELGNLTAKTIADLTTNTEPYLSCDDCFEQVDAVVDAVLDADAALSEPFRVHLLSCPACHQEAVALAGLAAPEHDLSEQQAIERLDAAIVRST